MVESARNHHQGLLPTPTSGDDEAAIQDTVGDDAATFTLTFNEVERHIACRWPSAGPAYFFLPAPCFCESAEPATLLTDLELFGLLSTFAAFDATGFDVVFLCAMLFILLPWGGYRRRCARRSY